MILQSKVAAGIMGLAVADALGVPVEFCSRSALAGDPVIGMRGYGTYNLPPGSWSDDTSMTLCLMESLTRGLHYDDIMRNFHLWFTEARFTPHGEVFDMGNATRGALQRYADGVPPLMCGGKDERDNGNGSLMRILPLAFYLHAAYSGEITRYKEAMDTIHCVSSLTHAHPRSIIACSIYVMAVCALMNAAPLEYAVESGVSSALEYYREDPAFSGELASFRRLSRESFGRTPEEKIKSSGYVVDTLEAAFWCLLKTGSYRECVLKAVNLGGDTDTVAAVAGGLAGVYYGYAGIPEEWLAVIAKRAEIEAMCGRFYRRLNRESIFKLGAYIPYFETATRKSAYQYPHYDETVHRFINEFCRSNLVSYGYLDIIARCGLIGDGEKIKDAADTADSELAKAILTGYIMQERFCEGLFASAIEDRTILRLLKRLKQLAEEP